MVSSTGRQVMSVLSVLSESTNTLDRTIYSGNELHVGSALNDILTNASDTLRHIMRTRPRTIRNCGRYSRNEPKVVVVADEDEPTLDHGSVLHGDRYPLLFQTVHSHLSSIPILVILS